MAEMLTLGIDLASKPKGTAMCEVDWETGSLWLTDQVDDPTIVEAVRRVRDRGGVAAIDAPFGWPSAFVDAVSRYHAGDVFGGATQPQLRLRVTDLAAPGRRPLSVSSDRIATVAFRAARLLDQLGRIRRDGSDRIIEVYPAAALRQWGLQRSGYKLNRGSREAILDEITGSLPGLRVEPSRDDLLASADALDALVSAMVGRAKHLGLVVPMPREHAAVALREGWLWVPTPDGLARLL